MVHVPYRGTAPALTDLVAGQVQVLLNGPGAPMEYIKTNRVRALAMTSAARWDGLPDLPRASDFVPGYEASVWFGIAAPKGTPTAVVDALNKAINAGLADAKLKAKLADLGGTVFPGSPADFERLIAEETEKWAKVVKFSGARPD
jgi:tripartite-type tricarboxylate transporter receptor subunit TctC